MTLPWCALSGGTAAEQAYLANRAPYGGEQFIRCMADGEIVAWRVCKDYDSTAIPWRDGKLSLSTSFVLVEHHVQPEEHESSGLTFHTLYMNMAPFAAYAAQGEVNQRKVAVTQRYYASAEDVQASPARPAGTLPANTAVTLGDGVISRDSDRRQFTRVTLTAEAKNAAGGDAGGGDRGVDGVRPGLAEGGIVGGARAALVGAVLPGLWRSGRCRRAVYGADQLAVLSQR
ncbi:hypothetical protein JNO12_15535 [Erwinia aphidicola]|nr:hypothetical protein [Erwinia aphidicola]